GARSVVITSACVDGKKCVTGRRNFQTTDSFRQNISDGLYFSIEYDEIPVAFHGTGDIFSAVLIGYLMNGNTLKESTEKAMSVVSNLIYNNRAQADKCLGIPVEKCLDLLKNS
ncbi:MAG: bifunctional hydroxymethylpyrimidine kinase/phosphomethylpyrimidine kinase, partial [Bacteroidales bacterium]|nr:bifunctional hydroxymethylpyrimidine kinase/phosphomethylpyrimidine kinase [Bacteroidales bacterium]